MGVNVVHPWKVSPPPPLLATTLESTVSKRLAPVPLVMLRVVVAVLADANPFSVVSAHLYHILDLDTPSRAIPRASHLCYQTVAAFLPPVTDVLPIPLMAIIYSPFLPESESTHSVLFIHKNRQLPPSCRSTYFFAPRIEMQPRFFSL